MDQSEECQEENSMFPFLINSLTDERGQIQFCQKLITKLLERGNSPCKTEFPEVKIERQFKDHYLKGICNLTQQYGFYTIEICTPSKFHGKYLIQTDGTDIEFSKIFTDYIKKLYNIKTHRERIH